MSVSFVARNTVSNGSGTSVSPTAGSPTVGDLLISEVWLTGAAVTVAVSAGWHLLNTRTSGENYGIAWRIATGSGDDPTWTWDGTSHTFAAVVTQLTGEFSAAPIGNHNANSGNSTTLTCPSITATADNAYIFASFATQTSKTIGTPTGFTQDSSATGGTSPLGAQKEFHKILAAAGNTTGVVGTTIPVPAVPWTSALIEIRSEAPSDETSDELLSDARSSERASSDHLLAEEISSDILLAEEISSDKAVFDAASSDEVAREAHSSDVFAHGGGPYFFAWADDGEAFDETIHTRFDDDVFEFAIEQQEGDFASLSLTIKNPRIGLLAPGRKLWGWFSWWNGTSVIPLFFGRLVGLPENLADEIVTLTFIARPSDFTSQKALVAEAARVRPFFDPIWFDASTRYEPDNILESRPEAWHIDRVSLVVTTSNILDGEDGTASFDESQVFYDSVKVGYAQNPLRSVTMNANVSWDQQGSGTMQFPAGLHIAPNHQIKSYTGQGLYDAWPKAGDSIGGGWSYATSSVSIAGAVPDSLIGEIAFEDTGLSHYVDGGFDTSLGTFLDLADGEHIGFSYHVAIPNITITWAMTLAWQANRRKQESLTFTLNADVQDIITLADDGEALVLTMSSSEVTNAVDVGPEGSSLISGYSSTTPIGPLARSYFSTDRGAQSIEYLIAVARAHLLARARCVKVDFAISFEDFVSNNITLRKNATMIDDRLPGGAAGGKIVAYAFGLSNGAQYATITIACTIGKNGTHDQITGSPDYVDAGYVDIGYQTYTGAYSLPFAETDVAYEDQSNVLPNDDGIDFNTFTGFNTIRNFTLFGANTDGETQEDALNRFTVVTNADLSLDVTNTNYAYVYFTLPNLDNGPFLTEYAVSVTDLKIPKTIDLEAPSEGASS